MICHSTGMYFDHIPPYHSLFISVVVPREVLFWFFLLDFGSFSLVVAPCDVSRLKCDLHAVEV
jgi:hypothetical protein